MRPRIFALLVGVLVGVLVLGAAPAHAVPPPPPPVTPYGDLPSRTANYYNPAGLTPGSPAYDEWLANMRAKVPPPVNSAMPSAAGAPKPITAPGTLARLSGTGTGLVLTGGYLVGWGIGTAGLKLYGQASGTDFDDQMCNYAADGGAALIDIHRGLNFGLGPDCSSVVPVLTRNADQPTTTSLAYGSGTLATYLGSGQYSYPIFAINFGGVPAGAAVVMREPGWSSTIQQYSGYCLGVAGCNAWSPYRPGAISPNGQPYQLALMSGSTVLATATTTKPNPTRTPGCLIDWRDGSTTTGTGTPYNEADGIPVSAEGLGCKSAFDAKPGGGPGGVMPSRIRVSQTPSGGSPVVISDQTVPVHTDAQKTALANPSTAGLVLTKTVAGVTDSCMTWAADCAGWWAATSSGTVATTGTTTYTCTFGAVAVSLSECGVYRQTFDVKTSNPVVTDPVTGDEEAWVPATGSTSPGNTGDPGTMPNGSTDPHGDCMAEWPSAPDPVSWVLHPVKCALVWAFVPREAEVTRLTGELTDMWEATGVGLTINTISAWQFVAPENGCSGVLVPMSTMFGHGIEDFYLLDACPGSPLAATAQWCFWIVLIASVINVIQSVTRNIGSIVGAKGVAEGDE